MQVGLVGLGRMGGNMAERLLRGGHEVVGYDRDTHAREALAAQGVAAAVSPEDLVARLGEPRTLWLMLPAGDVTAAAVDQFSRLLSAGDLLVDGANSHYKDSMRYGESATARGLEFVDAGVSGGIWGLENGYGLMVGGSPAAVARLRPVLETLAPAPDRGWVHVGPVGAGHYAKMVHNGIEYALMQAYGEGFELLRRKTEFHIDLAAVAEAWRHGTVIRGWLLDLAAEVLRRDQHLEAVAPYVAESGEGRWTALEAIELGVPAPTITLALQERFRSADEVRYDYRLLAMLRNAFGGHPIRSAEEAHDG